PAPAGSASMATTRTIRLAMVTHPLRGTCFRQRPAHGALEIRPGALDLGLAIDVVEMHLLEASQGVEQREEIHGACRVCALGDLDRLLGLRKMRAREEVVSQRGRPHAQPCLLDVAADRVRESPPIGLRDGDARVRLGYRGVVLSLV